MNIDITLLAADPDTGSEQCDECQTAWYVQENPEYSIYFGDLPDGYSVTCACHTYGSPLETTPIDPAIKITLS